MLEQHIGTETRRKLLKTQDVQAESFADSVGVGSYRIDLHPSTGGDNYIDISSLPFQIPLGALIPQRVENLLPACKNLGTTHITNGCFRLHPVEWAIGEAAGALGFLSRKGGIAPRCAKFGHEFECISVEIGRSRCRDCVAQDHTTVTPISQRSSTRVPSRAVRAIN